VVANEPRALTEASVSLEPGQFVPVERQTCWPATNNCVVETVVAPRTVVVTCVNVAFVAVSVCNAVAPRTVNVEVTVELAPMNPPRKYN